MDVYRRGSVGAWWCSRIGVVSEASLRTPTCEGGRGEGSISRGPPVGGGPEYQLRASQGIVAAGYDGPFRIITCRPSAVQPAEGIKQRRLAW